MSISLVAGLGNPGREYENTRHNIGFAVIDAFARQRGLTWKSQAQFDALTARWELAPGRTFILVKPQTYMNDSGRSVRALVAFYKIEPPSVVAIYDDLNIDLGLVKVTTRGSAGGHNGVASLLELVGGGFVRYRIGTGPKQPAQMDLKDFVLGKFTPEQQTVIDQKLDTFVSGLALLLEEGADRAMNTLNRRETK